MVQRFEIVKLYDCENGKFAAEDTFITVAVALAALIANIPIVALINRVGIR